MKRKRIKTIVLGYFLSLWAGSMFAQMEPAPKWYKYLPAASAYADFIYVTGMGFGADEKTAIYDAEADAYTKAMKQLDGTQVEQQTLNEIRNRGLKASIAANKLKQREACTPVYVYLKDTRVKAYVLYQWQKDAQSKPEFDEYRQCYDTLFEKRLKEFYEGKQSDRQTDEKQISKYCSFIPFGYSQFKTGHKTRGGLYMAGTGISLIGTGVMEYRRWNEKQNALSLQNRRKIERSENIRNVFIGSAIVFYVVNVIDGLFFCNALEKSALQIGYTDTSPFKGISLVCNF
jgi:hypothetical protein